LVHNDLLLSGFEDRFPITAPEKGFSIIIAFGVAVVAFITVDIASLLSRDRLEGAKSMRKHKDHVVICNWSPRGERIIKEVRNPNCPAKGT